MPYLRDYLQAVKDLSFAEQPLTLLDKVCINEIGYIPYDKWLSSDQQLGPTVLKEAYLASGQELPSQSFMMTKERLDLLELLLSGQRFAGLELHHYHSVLDKELEKQFAAMIFSLPEIAYHQVVFRGTDDSLIGWKEDFQLTYSREIPAHRSSMAYIKHYLPQLKGQIVLSGHSKGGNLALYTAVHTTSSLRHQITELLLLDSPGLIASDLELPSYQELMPKMTVIRPEESIVGVMLYWKQPAQIVASDGIGISQHNVGRWKVDLDENNFILVDQASALSQRLEQTFQEWMTSLSNRDLKLLFDIVFDSFIASGLESIDDLSLETIPQLGRSLQSLVQLPAGQKKLIQSAVTQLLYLFWQAGDSNQVSLPRLEGLMNLIKRK